MFVSKVYLVIIWFFLVSKIWQKSMLRWKIAISAGKTKDTTFSTYLPKYVGNCVSVMKLNIILVNKYALWKT